MVREAAGVSATKTESVSRGMMIGPINLYNLHHRHNPPLLFKEKEKPLTNGLIYFSTFRRPPHYSAGLSLMPSHALLPSMIC